MILKGCKRLAEMDFPIAVVSKHAVREKSIRHGDVVRVKRAVVMRRSSYLPLTMMFLTLKRAL